MTQGPMVFGRNRAVNPPANDSGFDYTELLGEPGGIRATLAVVNTIAGIKDGGGPLPSSPAIEAGGGDDGVRALASRWPVWGHGLQTARSLPFQSADGVIGASTTRDRFGRGNGIGVVGFGDGDGVLGYTSGGFSNTFTHAGVIGRGQHLNGTGVIGEANRGSLAFGVWGKSTSGYAGYFTGNVGVSGQINKAAVAFKIDHPLDPENKYLFHSGVESPDMKNLYDGTCQLDEAGGAWVELPEWFGELNRDFRYQLTAIGEPAPDLHVAEELAENRFKMAGGTAGMKVSWQVTGIRRDAWAERNRIVIEEDKPDEVRGTYLYPEGFDRPETRGEGYAWEEELRSRQAERMAREDEMGRLAAQMQAEPPGRPEGVEEPEGS